ncbi:MAG: sensor domain-containing phosphodiesterase [Magnetovibrionaceae bacterium]
MGVITATAKAEIAKRFATLAFCRADMLFELADDLSIAFSAGGTKPLLGRDAAELQGHPFTSLLKSEDSTFVTNLLKGADLKGRLDDIEVGIRMQSGAIREALLSGYRSPDFGNHFFLAIKLQSRVKPTKPRRQVDRDGETGMLNAETFSAAATRGMQAVLETGAEANLTLIKMAGLPNARQALSDGVFSDLMANIGKRLTESSVDGQSAGRLSDESFGLVHAGTFSEDDVERMLNDVSSETGSPVDLKPEVLTTHAAEPDLTEDQLRKAIEYTVRGFNQGDLGAGEAAPESLSMNDMFDQMMAETLEQIETFQRICNTRAFDLYFMPICDLKTGDVHHLETLSRFRHENTPSESPYRLITLAEEIGVISDFDIAVAQKTTDILRKYAATGIMAPLAFNVSGLSIANDEFVDRLHGILRTVSNLSGMISLEITETAVISDFERVNAIIQSFREKRFKVALDDFGAGATGFDYLSSFEIDAIKFDGPVVKRALQSTKGKAFLASMATLCNNLEIETVAEMVESADVARFLSGCGIHLGQGYHFGKPGPDPCAFRWRKPT